MNLKIFIFNFFFFTSLLNASYLDYIYKDRSSSYNSFGQSGLINLPSAETYGEGGVFLTLNRNNIYKYGTLTVTPYDWLEASYFYYRPSDLFWDKGRIETKGQYLDKGFNVKFSHTFRNKNLPKVAIGLDDFAGSGFFEKEYIVLTKDFRNIRASFGFGTGKFTGETSYKNPISFLIESFESRNLRSKNITTVGQPSYDQWFRGPIAPFGGVEIFLPKMNGARLKIENDPFDYMDFSAGYDGDANMDKRKKDSKINFGFSYPISKNFNLDISYIKGNTINFTFSLGLGINKNTQKKNSQLPKVQKTNPSGNSKLRFYRDLLNNLNNNSLLLQSANLQDEKLEIVINQDIYNNSLQAASYSGYISSKVAENNNIVLKSISVSEYNAGAVLNNITFLAKDLDSKTDYISLVKRNTDFSSGNPMLLENSEYLPRVLYPKFFYSIQPKILSHIGTPDKFYYGGLALSLSGEAQFNRNFYINFDLMHNIVDNFDRKDSFTDSPFLENVRTEMVDYLKGSDTYVSLLEMNYYKQLNKNLYTKLSAGIFEQMYGGFGGEILYKPFNSNFSFSANIYNVKKRDYDQRFNFQEYKTETGHITVSHYLPSLSMLSSISFGRYLANDSGFTFDFSRIFHNGGKAGFFFTLTDISFREFGEGSFDKGFYFSFPLDIFSNNYNRNNTGFKLRPLTRDGGAKLEINNSLLDIIHSSNMSELNQRYFWNEFLY